MSELDTFCPHPRLTTTPRQVERVSQPFWESANAAPADLFQQRASQLLALLRAQGCALPVAEELARKVSCFHANSLVQYLSDGPCFAFLKTEQSRRRGVAERSKVQSTGIQATRKTLIVTGALASRSRSSSAATMRSPIRSISQSPEVNRREGWSTIRHDRYRRGRHDTAHHGLRGDQGSTPSALGDKTGNVRKEVV
jgi:hypothetical protein